MKQFYLLSTLLCALAISNPVSAQITFDEVKTDPSERILKNEVRPTTVDAQSYFSRARYRAERAAIRKERNTLEFGGEIVLLRQVVAREDRDAPGLCGFAHEPKNPRMV